MTTSDLPARAGMSVLAGAVALSASALLVKLAAADALCTALLRCAIATIVLTPLAARESRTRGRLTRTQVGWSIGAGVALGIDYCAWTSSIYLVGAGIATVLINVQVLVLPLLALVLDHERPTRRFWATAVIMLAGLALVGDVARPGTTSTAGHVTGTLLGFLAGTGYGGYLYLTRRGMRNARDLPYQPLAIATATAATTAAVVAIVSRRLVHVWDLDARQWVLITTLAVTGQVLAWLLIHHGTTTLRPETTATLLLVQPVLTLLASTLLLNEHPRRLQWAGAAVVLLGMGALSVGHRLDHGSSDIR